METLRECAHEHIPVLAVDLEPVVQAYKGALDKSLEGFLAFSVEHQEPAVGLVAAAQCDDILLRQPAQSVVPAFVVEGPEAFDSVEVRLRVFAEQFREHLDLALVGPGYQLINHGNIVL